MSERSLASYLMIPRRQEAAVKSWFVPVAWAVVRFSSRGSARVSPLVALVAWLVFDLVVYQTRYMINDLADADVDRLHLAAALRGRLPGVPSARFWASRVIAVRLAVTAVAIALLPSRARLPMMFATLALALATIAYESARRVIRSEATMGAPRLGAAHIALFLLVGAGYGIRIGLGAALAGGDSTVVGLSIAFGWAFGVMFVMMTWILEGVGLRDGGDAEVLARKSHVRLLSSLVEDGAGWSSRPLTAPRAARLWSLMLGVASLLAVELGLVVSGGSNDGRVMLLLVVAVIAIPLVLSTSSSAWIGPLAVVVDVLAFAVATAGHQHVVAVVPLAGLTATAVAFRSFSPAILGLHPSGETIGP